MAITHLLLHGRLRRPDILKVGVGIAGDRMKLERDFGVDFDGAVDLSELASHSLYR